MRIRGSIPIVITGLLLIGPSICVERQLAREMDHAPSAKLPVSANLSQETGVASPRLDAPPLLPKDPDGREFERTVVRDAPFSATLITQRNQRVANGNVSLKTTTSLLYRDKNGRTRRDWLEESVAVNAVESALVVRSVINDPVSGFTYTLDHRTNTAQRTSYVGLPPSIGENTQALAKHVPDITQVLPMRASSSRDKGLQDIKSTDSSGQTSQSLGVREIEGTLAEGTRFVFLLPDQADNGQPAQIVAERWYAPSIQAVILVERSDSRGGYTTYRLTQIKRGESAKNLFTVPANYTIKDEVSRSRKTSNH